MIKPNFNGYCVTLTHSFPSLPSFMTWTWHKRWQWRTLCTGGSLPAVLADAGEGVSSSDTRPSVLARTRVTCAVLGYKTQKNPLNEGVYAAHRVRAAPQPLITSSFIVTQLIQSQFNESAASAWPVLQVLPPQPEGQLHRKESPWS